MLTVVVSNLNALNVAVEMLNVDCRRSCPCPAVRNDWVHVVNAAAALIATENWLQNQTVVIDMTILWRNFVAYLLMQSLERYDCS